jgi:hypothetical protein
VKVKAHKKKIIWCSAQKIEDACQQTRRLQLTTEKFTRRTNTTKSNAMCKLIEESTNEITLKTLHRIGQSTVKPPWQNSQSFRTSISFSFTLVQNRSQTKKNVHKSFHNCSHCSHFSHSFHIFHIPFTFFTFLSHSFHSVHNCTQSFTALSQSFHIVLFFHIFGDNRSHISQTLARAKTQKKLKRTLKAKKSLFTRYCWQ